MTKAFDDAVQLQLDIQRVAVSVQADVIRILKKLERELTAEVATADYTDWRAARVEKQITQVRKTIADYYAQANGVADAHVATIATVAGNATAVSLGADAVLPTAEYLTSLASNIMIQGAPSADWWAKQAGDTAFKFAAQVRQGIAAAETIQQIVRRVLDVMETSKAGAAALVHTAVSTVANDARMAVYQANADIIEVYRAVATLDSNTCFECAALDGQEWGPDELDQAPDYPLHINCRCLLMGRITKESPGGTRASSDGQVSAKTTFADWLDRQPQSVIEDTLGKGRAEMFTAGKITLSDLVNGRGNPLTLDQLKTKYQ